MKGRLARSGMAGLAAVVGDGLRAGAERAKREDFGANAVLTAKGDEVFSDLCERFGINRKIGYAG